MLMKLIAIDLDGTLLSKDCTISQENAKAVRNVQKQGDVVAISSGRSLHDTKQILQNADIDCPIITGNGAVAFHSDKIIQNLFLPVQLVSGIMEILEGSEFYYEVYTNEGIFILKDGRDLLHKEIESMQDFPEEWAKHEIDIQYSQHGLLHVPHYRDIDFTHLEVYKLFVLSFDKQKLMKLRDMLRERKDISLTSSGVTKLEIGHPEASKGNALAFMANQLKIPMENTVAIGDNLNDLSMFEVAGMSIAMENAEEEVKKLSTYITKHHDDDGVAYALRKYILNKN